MASSNHASQRVLVTGGTGFVAAHLIIQLLGANYEVIATIRDSSREPQIRKMVRNVGLIADEHLSFVVADLTDDANWATAMEGCAFVHHVASPFPAVAPKDEQELMRPAKEGTLRVLKFARDAGVRRVVMTSSFAAIGYGHKNLNVFTDEDWSIIDGSIPVPAYHKSKVLAEKAGWDFMRQEGGSTEFAVINPTGIYGPVFGSPVVASVQMIQKMIKGEFSMVPQLSSGIVDVRDLADLHIRAMTSKDAVGQRFLATSDSGSVSMLGRAEILRKERPGLAAKLPTWALPNFAVRTLAIFRPNIRGMLPELGVVKTMHNDKAKRVLGWKPRPVEETLLDTADSLVKLGLV